MNHPLKVYYPFGGEHFIINWSTYNERGHIILARSEQSALKIFAKVVEFHSDVEIKDYCLMDIVAPSEKLCIEAVVTERKDNVDQFLNEITSRLVCYCWGDAIEVAKLKFPKEFAHCKKFVSVDEEYPMSKADTEEHYRDCRNCCNNVSLVNLTPEQFYDKYYEKWQKINPARDYKITSNKDVAVYSQAEQAKDSDFLWIAHGDYGHHSKGLTIIDDYERGSCYGYPIAFYARNKKDLNRSPLEKMIKVFDERLELHQLKIEKARIDRQAKEKKQSLDIIWSLFDEENPI